MPRDAFADTVVRTIKAALVPRDAEVATLSKALAILDARLNAIEARAPVQGPPGPPGPPGPAGQDGKDGRDGKPFSTCHKGVWIEGARYDEGDMVSRAGSGWVCKDAGTSDRPGDGGRGWQLFVKRGRDGKDLREAPHGQ
jgi:hypothetical protein